MAVGYHWDVIKNFLLPSSCNNNVDVFQQSWTKIARARANNDSQKLKEIKVLYEQTRELTHDFLDYV